MSLNFSKPSQTLCCEEMLNVYSKYLWNSNLLLSIDILLTTEYFPQKCKNVISIYHQKPVEKLYIEHQNKFWIIRSQKLFHFNLTVNEAEPDDDDSMKRVLGSWSGYVWTQEVWLMCTALSCVQTWESVPLLLPDLIVAFG